MIKVVAFDLVGVLIREKDINLSGEEAKIERLFGANISDDVFLEQAKDIISNQVLLINKIKLIFKKIYEVREENLLKDLKGQYPNVKIVVATNHVSYIRDFIYDLDEIKYLDDIFISAEINKIKPDEGFYEHILNKLNIKNNELIFLDDSVDNISGAKKLGINTILVNKGMMIEESVKEWLTMVN